MENTKNKKEIKKLIIIDFVSFMLALIIACVIAPRIAHSIATYKTMQVMGDIYDGGKITLKVTDEEGKIYEIEEIIEELEKAKEKGTIKDVQYEIITGMEETEDGNAENNSNGI